MIEIKSDYPETQQLIISVNRIENVLIVWSDDISQFNFDALFIWLDKSILGSNIQILVKL